MPFSVSRKDFINCRLLHGVKWIQCWQKEITKFCVPRAPCFSCYHCWRTWFQICPKTDFQVTSVPTGLEKRAPYLRTLPLAGIRETCRDGGPCCCLLIPSCAGRASWGGVHLGCFHGAVDAVSASVLDVLLNSFILSDPATLHTLPFRFSDPDKLGWVVCSGFFCLVGFMLVLGFFAHFPWPCFSMEMPWIPWTPGKIGVKECSAQGLAQILYSDFFDHTPSHPFPFSCIPKAQDQWGRALCVVNSLLDHIVENKGFPQGAAPPWINLFECQVANRGWSRWQKVWNGRWPAGLVTVCVAYSCHLL